MPNQGRRDWSELPAGAKKFYKSEGINAGAYNKWWSMSQADRTDLTRRAKAGGYENGMKFLSIQGQVRTWTNKRITTRTPPKEAARKLLQGTGRRSQRRKILPRLFDFSEFDRLEWSAFLGS